MPTSGWFAQAEAVAGMPAGPLSWSRRRVKCGGLRDIIPAPRSVWGRGTSPDNEKRAKNLEVTYGDGPRIIFAAPRVAGDHRHFGHFLRMGGAPQTEIRSDRRPRSQKTTKKGGESGIGFDPRLRAIYPPVLPGTSTLGIPREPHFVIFARNPRSVGVLSKDR